MSSPNSQQAPGHNKTTLIIVNGRPKEVEGQKISYAQVVQLAFPNDQSSNDIEYTVTFSNPHGHDGALVSDESTHIQEGVIFNVNKTNRS